VLFVDFENAQAVKEFERAISLNPNYATAHQWYATGPLAALGEFDRGTEELKRALELDPVSPIISVSLGMAYAAARRYNEAIAQLRDAAEMHPEFYWAHRFLGIALELKGDVDGGLAEYKKAFELNDDPAGLAFIAHAEAGLGQQNETRRLLTQLTEARKSRYVQAYAFALTHLALGEKDQALNWLEQGAHERGGTYLCFIKVDPFFDSLRGDPRFEALVQKVAGGKS